jgi:hypothetical protein
MKALVLSVALLINSGASAMTLLTETFESVTNANFTLPAPGGFTNVVDTSTGPSSLGTFNGSSGQLWYVNQNNIDFINGAFGAPNNTMAVDLNGSVPGTLSTFVSYANSAASVFTLEFDYWGNGGAGRVATVYLEGNGTVPGFNFIGSTALLVTPPITSQQQAAHAIFTWVREGGTGFLARFSGYNPGDSGVTIDNIVLTQTVIATVPSPSGFLLIALGLGFVGVFSRKTKI